MQCPRCKSELKFIESYPVLAVFEGKFQATTEQMSTYQCNSCKESFSVSPYGEIYSVYDMQEQPTDLMKSNI
jgi:transposase-like protein